ncbi:MAG: hypothetical protein ACXWNK_18320, partial [Vulcanimicrobiaceae bacterium]
TWCLGLKDAAGPRSMDRRRLGGFIQQIFSAWDEPAVQAPLELGRQIVYGAIGYARELGFEPHADFGRAAGYLGATERTRSSIVSTERSQALRIRVSGRISSISAPRWPMLHQQV